MENKRGEKEKMKLIRVTLEAVHTHTHTHRSNLLNLKKQDREDSS